MQNSPRKVRTRYAPSPTGYQHIGGIRTAILNYFVARSLGGEFILRIEDTDTNRFVAGTEQYILDTLKWLNIPYSEGPDIGGTHAPYRQSERKEIYKEYALQLIQMGKAYYAFDSIEVLEQAREDGQQKGILFYNYLHRQKFSNSLSLSKEVVAEKLAAGTPYVIRLKLPDNTVIKFNDLIRGDINVHTSELDDRVLLKSDGWPTYHLANVVDDKLMQITHVIRGEEWLPSAPIHHYLYKAFDWEDIKPQFAHLPLVLNPDGDGKLSKRKLKDANIPIFPLKWTNNEGNLVKGMREEGFLPEAVINLLLLLGWNTKDGQEIFTREEIVAKFKISDIHKSGAKFDYNKAKWINHEYIMSANIETLANNFVNLYEPTDINLNRLNATLKYNRKRITTLKELENYSFLFKQNFKINMKSKEYLQNIDLRFIKSQLEQISIWHEDYLKDCLKEIIKKHNGNLKIVYAFLREAISGQQSGPDVVESLLILGKDESLERLNFQLKTI